VSRWWYGGSAGDIPVYHWLAAQPPYLWAGTAARSCLWRSLQKGVLCYHSRVHLTVLHTGRHGLNKQGALQAMCNMGSEGHSRVFDGIRSCRPGQARRARPCQHDTAQAEA
jgi:hypothetical protein